MIAGIFLAAGSGRRFGSDKLLADFRGKPLIYHSLKPVLESSLPRVYLVRDAADTTLQTTIDHFFPGDTKLTPVLHQHPERGMMSSLKLGLRTVSESCDGVMVLLGDMPGLTARLVDTLLRAFKEKNSVVIPECGGEWQHPRVIPSRLFPEFLRLGDDETGMRLLERVRKSVVTIPIGEAANYVDIDTAEDLDGLATPE